MPIKITDEQRTEIRHLQERRDQAANRLGVARVRYLEVEALELVNIREAEEMQRAFEYLQQAIELDPNHAGSHAKLGELFARTDNLAKATEHYEQAVRLRGGDLDLRDRLGVVLTKRQDFARQGGDQALAPTSRHEQVTDPACPFLCTREG